MDQTLLHCDSEHFDRKEMWLTHLIDLLNMIVQFQWQFPSVSWHFSNFSSPRTFVDCWNGIFHVWSGVLWCQIELICLLLIVVWWRCCGFRLPRCKSSTSAVGVQMFSHRPQDQQTRPGQLVFLLLSDSEVKTQSFPSHEAHRWRWSPFP